MNTLPPPPPPSGSPPPPPPGWGAAPPPSAPPQYAQYQYGVPAIPMVPVPPSRPAIPLAAALMLAGAVVVVVGCALTWLSWPREMAFGVPQEWNGYTEVFDERNDGIPFTVMAVIIAGFGITSLAAKRVLPVVIIGLVVAGFGLIAAIADLADIADSEEFAASFEPDVGPGLPVVIAGFAVTIAGFVMGIARRRRVSA